MREILFRGKRVNNGKWVYGSLYVCGRKDGKCENVPMDKKTFYEFRTAFFVNFDKLI